jgi:hypothetical protein
LFGSALDPQTYQCPAEDESKNQECRDNKRVQGEKNNELIPRVRLKRNSKGTQGDYYGEEEGEKNATKS